MALISGCLAGRHLWPGSRWPSCGEKEEAEEEAESAAAERQSGAGERASERERGRKRAREAKGRFVSQSADCDNVQFANGPQKGPIARAAGCGFQPANQLGSARLDLTKLALLCSGSLARSGGAPRASARASLRARELVFQSRCEPLVSRPKFGRPSRRFISPSWRPSGRAN